MMVALLTAAFSASLTFMQLGFVGIILPADASTYAVMLLMPVAMGSLLLGTITGSILGLFAGAVLLVHSIVMPLDFNELALTTPLSSIVLFGASGFLAGVLFSLVLKKERSYKQSLFLIMLACAAVSWFFSLGYAGNILLLLAQGASPRLTAAEFAAVFDDGVISMGGRLSEAALQAWVDTAIMSLLCCGSYAISTWLLRIGGSIGIRVLFGISIALVTVFAFVANAAISFVTVTLSEHGRAEASMRSEVNYLCLQLESLETRAQAFLQLAEHAQMDTSLMTDEERADYELLSNTAGDVLDGYTMQETGTVALLVDGTIIMTDDERLVVGGGVGELLGEDVREAVDASVSTGELQRIPCDGVLAIPNQWVRKTDSLQIAYLLAKQQGEYTVMIIEPSRMFYRNRTGVMGREAAISINLLVVVTALVSYLLESVVARRIDETNRELECITSGDLDTQVSGRGTLEFKSLAAGINQTVDALKDWIAEAETRMDSELAAARAIQESALPRTFPPFPDIPEFDLYASMNPAREVGGDFYDFFLIGDSGPGAGKVGFVVADVSGKGVPASLFMMRAKALIRDSVRAGLRLDEAVEVANDQLSDGNDSAMFVTAWIGVLDYATGHVEYVNAGHNPPLWRSEGSWYWLRERSGMALGVFAGVPFRVRSFTCAPGDKILLYTDGVTEAMDVHDELFGEKRLIEVACACDDATPRELVEAVQVRLEEHTRGAEQSDDITMLALELRDAPSPMDS